MTKYLTYLIKKERRVLRNSFLQQSYSINDIMQWMVTSYFHNKTEFSQCDLILKNFVI